MNGFAGHNAHDALGDVRATIYVANQIRNRSPQVWNQTIANLDRGPLLAYLKAGKVFQLVERFGGNPPRVFTGVYCGFNTQNSKRIGFADLGAENIEKLFEADDKFIEKAVGTSPILVRSVDLGSMPMLFPAADVPTNLLQLASKFANHKELQLIVGKKLADRFVEDTEMKLSVEDRIYEKFYNREDSKKLDLFHKIPWVERPQLLSKISDDRLRELGKRLQILYDPQSVAASDYKEFWQMIARRWSGEEFYGADEKRPGNTYASIEADLTELRTGARIAMEPELLANLEKFYLKRKF